MCPKGHIFLNPTHPTLQHEDQHMKTMSLWTWFSCLSPTWPSPPSNMKGTPMGVPFMFNVLLAPPQHEKHIQWMCFSCLAHSWATHPPSKHKKHALIDVFFIFGTSLVLPTPPPL